MLRCDLTLVLCVLSLGAVASTASATIVLPADLAAIVEGSQTIARGRVIELRSEMTAGRRSIHTLVTVAVDEMLKGSPSRTVTFRVPNGQVGRYKRIVVGAPEFAVGEDVVVFLRGAAPAMPTLFGLNQGVYRAASRSAASFQSFRQQVRRIVEQAH